MRLYICGAISNNPNYKRDFAEAKSQLQDAGYEVVSPATDIGNSEDKTWADNIINCLRIIADGHFDGIAVISDFVCVECLVSVGAQIEILFGRKLGITAETVDVWCREAFLQRDAKKLAQQDRYVGEDTHFKKWSEEYTARIVQCNKEIEEHNFGGTVYDWLVLKGEIDNTPGALCLNCKHYIKKTISCLLPHNTPLKETCGDYCFKEKKSEEFFNR